MEFYRVCHGEETYVEGYHRGPYVDWYFTELSDMHADHSADSDYEHPSMRDMFRSYRAAEKHACGFTSLKALHDWFNGWPAELANAGFVIRVFDVPGDKIVSDEYQSAAPIKELLAVQGTAKVLQLETHEEVVNE